MVNVIKGFVTIFLLVQNCLTNYNASVIKPYQIEITDADKYYLAQCIQAEAGNQGELGKAYVCDCILNRLDYFGFETVRDVINDPGQFCVVENGIILAEPDEETLQVVEKELQNRTDYDIMYFRAEYFHDFGTPCFQYQDHFFSGR